METLTIRSALEPRIGTEGLKWSILTASVSSRCSLLATVQSSVVVNCTLQHQAQGSVGGSSAKVGEGSTLILADVGAWAGVLANVG